MGCARIQFKKLARRLSSRRPSSEHRSHSTPSQQALPDPGALQWLTSRFLHLSFPTKISAPFDGASPGPCAQESPAAEPLSSSLLAVWIPAWLGEVFTLWRSRFGSKTLPSKNISPGLDGSSYLGGISFCTFEPSCGCVCVCANV